MGSAARIDLIEPEAVTPIVLLITAVLGVIVFACLVRAGRVISGRCGQFSWRMSLRRVGWLPAAAAAAVALFLYYQAPENTPPLARERVVETVIPLFAGVQAAFLFSPEDESALEVTLACPRPLAWTLLERAAALLAVYTALALLSSAVAASVMGESLDLAALRWVAPLFFLASIGICLTLITRQAALSVGLVLLWWFSLAWFGDLLLLRWPQFWPVQIFLQPAHAQFLLNRAVITLAGWSLMAFAAGYLLRDEERVLLGGRAQTIRMTNGE